MGSIVILTMTSLPEDVGALDMLKELWNFGEGLTVFKWLFLSLVISLSGCLAICFLLDSRLKTELILALIGLLMFGTSLFLGYRWFTWLIVWVVFSIELYTRPQNGDA